MRDSLASCRDLLGDDVTVLYEHGLPESVVQVVEEQGREQGGPWNCYDACDFYGWEDSRVVAVTEGVNIMEEVTRARTSLCIIMVDDGESYYTDTMKDFQQAADQGLVTIM